MMPLAPRFCPEHAQTLCSEAAASSFFPPSCVPRASRLRQVSLLCSPVLAHKLQGPQNSPASLPRTHLGAVV